jgi:hypothetical protein
VNWANSSPRPWLTMLLAASCSALAVGIFNIQAVP